MNLLKLVNSSLFSLLSYHYSLYDKYHQLRFLYFTQLFRLHHFAKDYLRKFLSNLSRGLEEC